MKRLRLRTLLDDARDMATPIDPHAFTSRVPAIAAPCHCGRPDCLWPFCPPTAEHDPDDEGRS